MKFALLVFLFSFSALGSFAEISKIHGKVIVNIKTMGSKGMSLKENDIVEAVGKSSYVEISFSSGHKVRVRNGKTVLRKITNNEVNLKLIKGKIFSYVNKLKPNHKFQVTTKHTSMGVRGTMFMVGADEKETYLCVCEGSVVSKRDGKQYTVNKGFDQTFKENSLTDPLKANDQMMNMATSVFLDMGYDL
ncbi:hypothetical protein A9Q84_07830 [Halobacteriovorax marinus]|uniref:FecR protein domain-containing protein n=1 Tax=Halobacteriovorax marinus TaxID=97084 RepID=A0A1Y5F5U1_9BACT|nr:hypothetical protein A9Q84_07830 [Halobacteriovorax marinus]